MSVYIDIKKKLNHFTLDVKIEIGEEFHGILGASGCGKSMTLKCVAGIETPDEGVIRLNGKTLFDSGKKINLPPQQRNIGYLFQNYALFPNLTVEDNIKIGMEKAEKKRKGSADELIRMFRLEKLEGKYPAQLSGGEQQRVALARMIACQPELIMLDEPFSALDSYLKWSLEQELQEQISKYGRPVLFVSHSRDEVYRLCDSISILSHGQVEEAGLKEAVFKKPATLAGAKMTGCKNFSEIELVDTRTFYAKDWKIKFHTGRPLKGSEHQAGIRARYIKILEPGETSEHSVCCNVVKIIDDLFEVQGIVQSIEEKEEKKEAQIQIILPKDKRYLLESDTIEVEFPEESLIIV